MSGGSCKGESADRCILNASLILQSSGTRRTWKIWVHLTLHRTTKEVDIGMGIGELKSGKWESKMNGDEED